MGTLPTAVGLFAVLSLLLSGHHGNAAKVRGLCHVGGRLNHVRTFIGVIPRMRMKRPCRYKLVNMRCGGDQTEVWADNDVSYSGDTLVNGLTVKVTTRNNGGGTTVQTLALTTQQLQAYLAAGNLTTSPWQWSSSGVPVDPDKKIVGHYDPDAERGRGVVVVGGLNVSLSRFQGGRGRRIRTVRILFKCKSHRLHFYQDYPETLCGTANTTRSDVDKVMREINLDPHHYQSYMQDDYLLWVKQRDSAMQTKPLCQEASNIINSAQCSAQREEVLYDCAYLLYDRSNYAYCIKSSARWENYTVMEVYTTCIRLMCGVEGAASNETCALLQTIQAACAYVKYGGPHTNYRERANCTFTPVTSPQKRRRIYYRGNGVCRDPDRVPSWGYYSRNKPTTGPIETFSKQYRPRTVLPCRYKMANIRCGDYKTEIYVDYTNDARGHTFLDGVTIKALTKSADGQRLVQINKLTNKMLKQYIAEGNFTQTPWKWTYRGDTQPSPADRVVGGFNQTTGAGVYVSGNLTVTYTYINPRNGSRGVADVLRISCTDPDFRARQSYPETLCGSPKDTQPGNQAALDPPKTSDIHHHYTYFLDPLLLARQDAKQSNPLCEETANIVSRDECQHLGDALYECNEIRDSYTRCLRSNDIDFFKVYVTCMNVLCNITSPTSSPTSSVTCNTLRDVAQACGYSEAHMDLRVLLDKAGCPSEANATTIVTKV